MGRRKSKQKKGNHGKEYCPGYVDEHGQWNNGFYCPKWSSKPNQQYCCGSQYKRYCCTPGESPQRVTQQYFTTSTRPPPTTTVKSTTALTTPVTTLAVTSVGLSSPVLQNIPLIVGATAGGIVLLIILILICCCVCPCCPMRKNAHNKNLTPEDEKSVERERERRISDVSDMSFQRPLTPSYRSESPNPPEMTVIPMSYTDTDTMTSSIPLTRTKHSPYKVEHYKAGVVVGTVPPYVREEPPPYPEEVMETLKPLMYGQICCSQRSCPKCQAMRLHEMCPMEMEMDPHQHCITSPLSTSVSSLHKQNYAHLKQGRYVRPLTPVLTPQSYRHFQIQNRGYIM